VGFVYRRKAIEERQRQERQKKLKADLPRRMRILGMVKRGEISLQEGQKMIRLGHDVNADHTPGQGAE